MMTPTQIIVGTKRRPGPRRLAKKLLQPLDVEEDTCWERYPCRLCSQSFESISDFRQHVQGQHSVHADDMERAYVEYRKKVLGFVRCAGPQAGWVVKVFWTVSFFDWCSLKGFPMKGMMHFWCAGFNFVCFVQSWASVMFLFQLFQVLWWSFQRNLIFNFDEVLRRPGNNDQGPRAEAACVVCARKFWKRDLKQPALLSDPDDEDLTTPNDTVAKGSQARMCDLLGRQRRRKSTSKPKCNNAASSAAESSTRRLHRSESQYLRLTHWHSVPRRTSSDVSENVSERMLEDMSDRMSERMWKGVSKRMSEDISKRMAKDMSERMSEDMSENMSEDMSERMSKHMSERMSEDMPEEIPKRMSKDMSERMSEDMSQRMSEDMSDRMSENMSKIWMSENMPERMPKVMPEDVSERRSKICQEECQKICQKECQKTWQKICQKECQKEC